MTCVKIVRLFGATNVINAGNVVIQHHRVKKDVELCIVKIVYLHVSTATDQDARNALATESVVGAEKLIVKIVLVVKIVMW